MQCPECYYPNSAWAWRCHRCGRRLHSTTAVVVLSAVVVGAGLAFLVAIGPP